MQKFKVEIRALSVPVEEILAWLEGYIAPVESLRVKVLINRLD